MSDVKRKFGLKHGLALLLAIVVVAIAVLGYVVTTGLADRWARRTIIEQLAKTTGARVELGKFEFGWWSLHARFDGLTLHGREPAGTPPLFHADKLEVDIRVESFLSRAISLGNVEMSHFSAHIRTEPDGSTNIPSQGTLPKPSHIAIQSIFDLKIARLNLDDGEILWNDTRIPLAAEGGKFQFAMDYASDSGQPVYLGRVSWQNFEVAARRFIPFSSNLSAKFTLRQDSFTLTQLQWKIPHSEIDAQADRASFSRPAWTFRFRGQSSLEDLKSVMRMPNMPAGQVEFSGGGRYAEDWSVNGLYTAGGITMNDVWFHAGEISSRGSYHADQHSFDVPDLQALAFGGNVTGRLHVDIPAQKFRFESHCRGFNLGHVLAAENNPDFPVVPLHWTGRMDVDAVTSWVANFQHLDSQGVSSWTFANSPGPREIPASAHLDYHYEMDRKQVEIAPSEIMTPSSHLMMHGTLGATNSALDINFDTEDLVPWDDFINRLRGQNAVPQRIAGRFEWQGRLTGPLIGPTFAGHVKGSEARYGALYWDEIECEMSYSPDELHITRGRVRRGRSSVDLELALAFDDWSFLPRSQWTLDTTLVGADPDDVQEMLGTFYPVHGILGGQFHGKGTRANPELSGLFDLSGATVGAFHMDRARGQLTINHDEVRIADAEFRLPTHAQGAPAGLITGNVLYHTQTSDVSFDIAGAGIPLEGIDRIQTASLPLGGRLNLEVRGQGPLLAPELHGTVRLVDLKVGGEVIGSFDGKVDSEGRMLTATIESALPAGRLTARFDVNLGGDYPLTGDVTAEQIDCDPLIVSALHLTGITGHSRVDGHFAIAGFAAQPDTIAIDANLSRIALDYDYVKLENNGPVRITYHRNEVQIEQANLRGADTDFHASGSMVLRGDRVVDMRVDGAVTLQILGSFVPRLEATGRAQMNAAITGLMAAPRIIGKVHVEGATLRYGDFPAGLSNLAGDFNFDTTRVAFENVSAESGGGHLTLGGAMTYGNGAVTYTINATSEQVRVRYPEGMSWLVAGTLRLSGNARAATLSGRILVDRLLMAESFDLAAFMASAKGSVSGPSTSSSFMRNLDFDIQADSKPDTRMEWPGATFQTDANLRLRGTWDHPILLGHIHLLSGEMNLRGNKFTIARGDINFANPFRLDPTLNVEATTTIRQYEVTLDFTGLASRLTLAYRSDPPLPSSDIIALLALGSTSEESAERSTTGQSSQLGASALLSEAISSQVGGRIERLFGVSHFSVGPSVVGPTLGQNSIASVTIEQQVTPNLVIMYTTDVSSTQYEIIQAEYTINREFYIEALRDENGTFGIDVVRKTRFK